MQPLRRRGGQAQPSLLGRVLLVFLVSPWMIERKSVSSGWYLQRRSAEKGAHTRRSVIVESSRFMGLQQRTPTPSDGFRTSVDCGWDNGRSLRLRLRLDPFWKSGRPGGSTPSRVLIRGSRDRSGQRSLGHVRRIQARFSELIDCDASDFSQDRTLCSCLELPLGRPSSALTHDDPNCLSSTTISHPCPSIRNFIRVHRLSSPWLPT